MASYIIKYNLTCTFIKKIIGHCDGHVRNTWKHMCIWSLSRIIFLGIYKKLYFSSLFLQIFFGGFFIHLQFVIFLKGIQFLAFIWDCEALVKYLWCILMTCYQIELFLCRMGSILFFEMLFLCYHLFWQCIMLGITQGKGHFQNKHT